MVRFAPLSLALSAAGCSRQESPDDDPWVDLYHRVLDIPTTGPSDVADPHVVYDDGTWFLFATHDKETQELWTSQDLVTWAAQGVVWEPEPDSWAHTGEVWAPSVHPGDGGWYLYYTSGLRIGVAWSESLYGPFEDALDHPLVGGGYGGVGDGVDSDSDDFTDPLNFEEFSIDAFVYDAGGGSRTLYCTRYTPLSQLVAVPLLDWTTVVDTEPVLISQPGSGEWDFPVNEGPWVLEHEGRVHLGFSGNQAQTEDYAVGGAVGDDPLGPFERYPDNPLLASSGDIIGPGHHSLVSDGQGRTLIFYHSKDSPEVAWNRHLRFGKVEWVDGQMVLDPPLP